MDERTLGFVLYLRALGVSTYRISERINRRLSQSSVWWLCRLHSAEIEKLRDSLRDNLWNRKENGNYETDASQDFARDELQEIQDHEPVNSLDFLSGLGTELTRFDRYKIIRNSCGKTKDIGVRERILGQYLAKGLDSRLRKLLEAGSRTLKQLGLENEPHLGNALGVSLRKIYRTHYARKRRNINYKRVVHSSVAYLLQWHTDYQSRIKPNLKIDPKIVKLASKLAGIPAQRV